MQFVRPKLIAEIHGEDLLSSEAGRELKTQLLRFDPLEQGYEFLGLSVCPRLSFARFDRLREEKELASGGARIEQVGKLATPSPTAVAQRCETRVHRRECYAKGEMLRKLLVVHKDDPDLAFPYLIYWTDYSAKRPEPLKVSTEIAATQERATALAERALKDGLSKGFVAV